MNRFNYIIKLSNESFHFFETIIDINNAFIKVLI